MEGSAEQTASSIGGLPRRCVPCVGVCLVKAVCETNIPKSCKFGSKCTNDLSVKMGGCTSVLRHYLAGMPFGQPAG